MSWRTLMGFKPTEADFARELVQAAKRRGDSSWQYSPTEKVLKSGERLINLPNLFKEYVQAPVGQRQALREKAVALLASVESQVPALWGIAQAHVYPLLRSRYELSPHLIKLRHTGVGPTRVSLPFSARLELVIGYDFELTTSQVTISQAEQWGLPLELLAERARANLRALPKPGWVRVAESVWGLESSAGYTESFLQLPSIFETLPIKGSVLAMIPNRGVLFATGEDEPDGLHALLSAAEGSFKTSPWPLSSELFRVSPEGVIPYQPAAPVPLALSNMQKLDLGSLYDAQKHALEAHFEATKTDIFVATLLLFSYNNRPHVLHSACVWTEGVDSLLPKTDFVRLLKDPQGSKEVAEVTWAELEAVSGHRLQATNEDPPRIRVTDFPNSEEWKRLSDA